VDRAADAPDRWTASHPEVPGLFAQARLIIEPDNKIMRFETLTSLEKTLNVGNLPEQPDQFEFARWKPAVDLVASQRFV
jgi:hypothetical protein